MDSPNICVCGREAVVEANAGWVNVRCLGCLRAVMTHTEAEAIFMWNGAISAVTDFHNIEDK